MRRLVFLSLAGLIFSAAIPALPTSNPEELIGTWRVDLRPTPDAEPYYQDFVVTGVEDGALTGSFYGSDIEEARLNTDWGPVHFAFITRDGSGVYHTTGVLRDGALTGTTHSLGRDFLAVWRATKAD